MPWGIVLRSILKKCCRFDVSVQLVYMRKTCPCFSDSCVRASALLWRTVSAKSIEASYESTHKMHFKIIKTSCNNSFQGMRFNIYALNSVPTSSPFRIRLIFRTSSPLAMTMSTPASHVILAAASLVVMPPVP